MKRMLYGMWLYNDDEGFTLSVPVEIHVYCAKRHHEAIRNVYGRSFGDAPWPSD